MRKPKLSGSILGCFIIVSFLICGAASAAIAAPTADFSGAPAPWNPLFDAGFGDNSSGTISSWYRGPGAGTGSAGQARNFTASLRGPGQQDLTGTRSSAAPVSLAEQAPAGEEYLIQVDPSAHQRYGLFYPVTYKFRLPPGSQGLTAQYRYWEGSWNTLAERSKGDIFNGIDAVRFDYGSGFAYVSVGLSRSSDEIHLRVVDGQGQPVALQFDSIPKYYDDRNAVVTVTLDDWNTSFADYFDTALDYLFNDGLYFSTAIITSDVYWNRVQQKIDQYGDHLEIASHTMNHSCTAGDYAVSGYRVETAGSRDALRQNLRFGANPYIPLLVEPCGYSDDQLQAALTSADYLLSRSANNNPVQGMVFAPWDEASGRYSRGAVSYDDDVNVDDAKLLADTNAAFDQAIAAGGIYHLMDHPSKGFWHPDSYLLQHLHYISGKSELWYVPFGQLYLYHFLQEMRGNLNVIPVSAGSLSASFFAAPLTGTVPLQVSFSDRSTGGATEWLWDFGDGASSTEQNPVHQYLVPGNYPVKLTVSGSGGNDTRSAAGSITVKPPPPSASFSAAPLTGLQPLPVSFSDGSTGAVSGWAWDFGDGTSSTEQNPVHLYPTPGTYTVRLTVSGPGGSDTKNAAGYITVNAAPPSASFSATPVSGYQPLTVSFSDGSTGTISDWAWDFGDGMGSTQQNPVHRYPNPGTFTVKLTVSGPGGSDTKSSAGYITVKIPPPTASFSAAPLIGYPPLSVGFSDGSTGAVSGWAWDFGDGGRSGQPNPVHLYNSPGTYSVKLTVTGTGGSDNVTRDSYITVKQPIPGDARITAPASGSSFTAPATINISAAASGSNDADVAKVDFYAGPFLLGSATAAPYNFTWDSVAPGGYSLTVQMTDRLGGTASSTPVWVNVTKRIIRKKEQSITVSTAAPVTAGFGSTFTVAASAPGGPVAFSSAGGCSNAGTTFTMTSGTRACTVIYDQAGNADYNPADQISSTTAALKASQAITVGTAPPASAGPGATFTVAASAPGGAVAYSSAGGCSNTGATFTLTGTTSCTVICDQAGNDNYKAAPQLKVTVSVDKASQSITWSAAPPASAPFGASFTVAATAPGGAVSFTSAGGCSNNGATFTMTSGATPCTVICDQQGNAGYASAPQKTATVAAVKAEQRIAVTVPPPDSAKFGSSFTVAATAPGGAVSYGSGGGCSNDGASFTVTSGTTSCLVRYNQPGSGNYDAATEKLYTVPVAKAPQSITVTTPAPASAAVGSSFTVAASAPGGPVSYASSGGCSNQGATFTMTSAATACTVRYAQAGSADYQSAETSSQTTAARKEQVITVTTPAPASAVFGSSFTVGAAAPGGAVSYSSAGGCSNSGASFTMTSGSTPCTVRFDQAGNAEYGAAATKTSSTLAAKAAQSITITPPAPASAAIGSSFAVSATAPGGAVSFASAGGCSNNGATFTMTSASTPCAVSLDQAGSADYSAAHLGFSVAALAASEMRNGDLNGDGVVDIRDAMGALNVSVGLQSATPDMLARADIAPLVKGKPSPDGKIDVGDVIVILRKSVGLVNW